LVKERLAAKSSNVDCDLVDVTDTRSSCETRTTAEALDAREEGSAARWRFSTAETVLGILFPSGRNGPRTVAAFEINIGSLERHNLPHRKTWRVIYKGK
jgi:hypothetical protein